MDKSYFRENLKNCKSYGEIFDLVKKAVKKTLGLHRVGLLLYLSNLPPNIGAYHILGSNIIVLNKLLIYAVSKSMFSKIEFNSLVFSLLLHEYLHSLGFLNEREVRRLVYKVSLDVFGEDHPAVRMAVEPPLLNPSIMSLKKYLPNDELEIIRNFEKTESSYIA